MNAWTGPDYTAYPFSTQNSKDFYNLLSVYLEMVFNPLLRKTDFLQQAWRYDLENNQTKQEKNENLFYKGVVLNEMKGAMQTTDSIFDDLLTRNIFGKNHPYGFNSGGDPLEIVNLSYQETKQFYSKYYHPSNSKFLSYGDIDFTKTLEFLDTNYLSKYDDHTILGIKHIIPNVEQIFKDEEIIRVKGPADPVAIDSKKQTRFAITFLCCDITKPENDLTVDSLKILSYLLFDTPSSPFYRELIESGIASSFTASNGYNSSYKQSIFTISVNEIQEN